MIAVLRGVLIAYVVVWAVLLIACLRKREFCPIFSDSRKTRLFWLATFVLVNPLLTILYFFFGQIRSAQARPVRAVRDFVVVFAILGFFVNIPGLTHFWVQPFLGRSSSADEGTEAHLAAIQAANNTSTTSTSAGNGPLACRCMAVVVEGDHPLLYRVGSDLVEQFRKVPAVETAEFYDDGAFPTGGQRSPDVFVRLYLASIQETPIPYSPKLSAQIGADVGPAPFRSTHYSQDARTPPLFNFNLRIQMSHTSTTTGYESVRYTMAAQNIAKDLGEQIGKTLGQWQDKHGLLPELPDRFYGAYVVNEFPEPLKELEPVLLGSYTGLLKHNETYLQFTVADEPVEAITALRDAMTASGWKELTSDWKSPNIDLKLQKGNRRIDILQVRGREPFSGAVMISRPSAEKPVHLFGIIDMQRFRDDELNAVLEGLLTRPVSMEHLMLFERMFDKQQQERWLEILESQPPRDVFTQMRLGEMYQRRDIPEKAMQALRRARTLLWVEQDSSSYRNRLKSLAKRLGDETLANAQPAREDFLEAGFVELASNAEAVEMEADLNAPALVFFPDSQGGYQTFAITVVPSSGEKGAFGIRYAKRAADGASFGSSDGVGSEGSGVWQYRLPRGSVDNRIACQVTRIRDEDRFNVSVTVTR